METKHIGEVVGEENYSFGQRIWTNPLVPYQIEEKARKLFLGGDPVNDYELRNALYPPNRTKLEPEKKLMCAILEDAVDVLDKNRKARTSKGMELYQDTIRWIEERDTDGLFSFENICDVLGFNSNYLRDFLIRRESL